jgi:hypothetical protein
LQATNPRLVNDKSWINAHHGARTNNTYLLKIKAEVLENKAEVLENKAGVFNERQDSSNPQLLHHQIDNTT